MKKLKLVAASLLLLPFSVMADDVGSGNPGVDPDATDPGTPITSSSESESTWFDELLALFELDSAGEE